MRLIDADAVLAIIRPERAEDIESAMRISDVKRMIKNIIKTQPTVDAVQVVHCSECKHFMMMPDIHGNEYPACVQMAGTENGEYRVSRWVNEAGYCDWGEHK